MIARRGPVPALVTAALVALLAGCSGGDPKPTAAPTPTKLGPAVPAPQLPEAAKANTPDGATAFFRYYVALYNYSYATNDSAAIKKVSIETCTFCHGVIQNADLSAQQNVHTIGGDLVVGETRVSKGDATNGAIVLGRVTQRASRSLDAKGKEITARSSARELQMTALLRFVDGAWKTSDVQLTGAKDLS